MQDQATAEHVRQRIASALPGARVRVGTFEGSDHLQAEVDAPQFVGKSRLEQHRMVYAAVSDLIGGAVHALALTTRPLDQADDPARPARPTRRTP